MGRNDKNKELHSEMRTYANTLFSHGILELQKISPKVSHLPQESTPTKRIPRLPNEIANLVTSNKNCKHNYPKQKKAIAVWKKHYTGLWTINQKQIKPLSARDVGLSEKLYSLNHGRLCYKIKLLPIIRGYKG
jgi:hypothetical protein